jgi:hypothetical protein
MGIRQDQIRDTDVSSYITRISVVESYSQTPRKSPVKVDPKNTRVRRFSSTGGESDAGIALLWTESAHQRPESQPETRPGIQRRIIRGEILRGNSQGQEVVAHIQDLCRPAAGQSRKTRDKQGYSACEGAQSDVLRNPRFTRASPSASAACGPEFHAAGTVSRAPPLLRRSA